MSKHTKGPWHTKRVDNLILKKNSSANLLLDKDDFGIGILSSWKDSPETEEEATANANLIAAAPDMLEALETAREWIDFCKFSVGGGLSVLKEIDAAIAKARSEA